MSSRGRVSIPNNVWKTIQDIKEIAGNHNEDDEIYAMLKDCSMDPYETAQKLLLQDPFDEVRRKRDRKKEAVDEDTDSSDGVLVAELSAGTTPLRNVRYTPTVSPDTILWDQHQHISTHHCSGREPATPKLRGGSPTLCILWGSLPESMRTLVHRAGFGPFMDRLRAITRNDDVITVLAERWWDSTHTFHLPRGEITLTPLDFSCLTGLEFQGVPLLGDLDMYRKPDLCQSLLGTEIRRKGQGLQIGLLKRRLDEILPGIAQASAREVRQATRVFLMYMLGDTLFANAKNTVPLYLLAALRHFRDIHSYAWAAAGLSELYAGMDAYTRDRTVSVTGFCLLWELWAYETLGLQTWTLKESDFEAPVMFRWRHANRVAGPIRLNPSRHDMRARLNATSADGVVFFPWEPLLDQFPFAFIMTRSRLLMRSPLFDSFYLGERVTRQHGIAREYVGIPLPPPEDVLSPLPDGDHAAYVRGCIAADHFFTAGDYDDFARTRLMGPLVQTRSPSVAGSSSAVPSAAMRSSALLPPDSSGMRCQHRVVDIPFMTSEMRHYYYTGEDGLIQTAPIDVPEPEGVIPDVLEDDPDTVVTIGTFNRKCRESHMLRRQMQRMHGEMQKMRGELQRALGRGVVTSGERHTSSGAGGSQGASSQGDASKRECTRPSS